MKDEFPKMLPRYIKASPMTDEQYAAHYESTAQESGVETAAAAAAEKGLMLMVKSNFAPFYSVPHEIFIQEQRQGRHIESPLSPAEQYAAAGLTKHEAVVKLYTGSVNVYSEAERRLADRSQE